MPSAPTSKTALANLSSYSPSQFPYISAMPSLVDVRLDAEDVAAYTISQQPPPVSALATTRDHWHITPFEPAYSQSYFVNRNPFTAIELRSISNIGDHAQAVFTSLAAQNLSQLIELSRILESHRSSPSWHSSPFIDTVDFSSSPCQSPEQPAFVSDKSQLDKLLLALPVNLQESVVASIVQSNYSLIPPVSKTDAQRITDFMYKLQCISWMAERVMGIDVYEGAKRFSHRAIIKFAKQYDVVPRWLCLKKVTLEDQEREDGGEFSDVHRGRYNGRLVALKTMRYYQNMGEEKRKSLLQSLRLEALLWFRLKHKYVLPFLGLDWFNIWSKSPALVTPWMSCKNIRHTLDQSYGRTLKGGLFMGIVNKWLLQIAEGLEYLHNEGVVHGDLRGVNILLTDIWEVQLADFGLSVIAEAHSNQYGSTRGGAIRWVAPELITPETYNRVSTRPTYASDIYSFACICVELYTRRNPWHNLSDTQHPKFFSLPSLVTQWQSHGVEVYVAPRQSTTSTDIALMCYVVLRCC
ncbi:EKC/KEOPS complex subunit BUD32 [Abortiporus biennis]